MKVAMDADCLIKLTKAGLKERVCGLCQVSIPIAIQRETVLAAPALPDAVRIGQNIAEGRIAVASGKGAPGKGEEAVLALYQSGGFDAVGTDDARFIRRLRGLGLPYAVPAAIVVRLRRTGALSGTEAAQALTALQPHISAEEYAAAHLLLQGGESR